MLVDWNPVARLLIDEIPRSWRSVRFVTGRDDAELRCGIVRDMVSHDGMGVTPEGGVR